jgi:predicted phage-related endonuclease
MKIYWDIVQGSDEWHEIKWGKVGGSTIDDVTANEGKPVKNNAIFNRLLSERMEEFDPFEISTFKSNAMEVGTELEPVAAQEFERITGIVLSEMGWAEREDGFLGISPDRVVKAEIIKAAFETKCPTGPVYVSYLRDNSLITTKYAWQIVDYFAVFEQLETLYFFVFRPQNQVQPHILLEITRDTVIQVNKSKSGTVGQLVNEALNRVAELRKELENTIEELSKPKF